MDCKKNGENRQKHHARKKLKKAVKAATELVSLMETITIDSQSKLEAEAYLQSMQGALNIEYLQYAEAMNHLIKSKVIYQSILANKDSLEAAIYGDKVTQIVDLMKICSYNLQKFSEVQKTLEQFEAEFVKESKIKETIENSLSKQTKDTDEITIFLGKPIPKKLQHKIFKRVEDHLEVLHKSDSLPVEDKEKLHTEMIQISDECINVINKVKAEETKKSESTHALFI